MGCFNVTCSISNLSINEDDKVKLFFLKSNNDNTLDYTTSNILTSQNCLFSPALLPITGYYNAYGGIRDIEIDDNTTAIEEYFKVSIDDFVEEALTEGNDYGFAGMFVLNEVYNKLSEYTLNQTKIHNLYLLEESLSYFGFEEVSTEEQFFLNPHYDRLFRNYEYGYDLFFNGKSGKLVPTSEKDYITVHSKDLNTIKKNWYNITREELSTFPIKENSELSSSKQFNVVTEYLRNKFGYNISTISTPNKFSNKIFSCKELCEIWLDITSKKVDLKDLKDIYLYDIEIEDAIEKVLNFTDILNYSNKHCIAQKTLIMPSALDEYELRQNSGCFSKILYMLIDSDMFNNIYKNYVLDGKLKIHLRNYRAFESAMHSCNRFYFPAMVGEQNGDSNASKMLLAVSNKIIDERLQTEEY